MKRINFTGKNLLQKNEGFSLVELLVVMALVGLIISFVGSVYIFSERSFLQWERNIRLVNELHTILNGLSENLYNTELIDKIGKYELQIKLFKGDEVEYSLERGDLLRNKKSLLNEKLSVVKLLFSSEGDRSSFFSSSFQKQKRRDFKIVKIQLALTDGSDTLKSHRFVYLRTPSLWKPLR